jgi:hypothetical protein
MCEHTSATVDGMASVNRTLIIYVPTESPLRFFAAVIYREKIIEVCLTP